MRYGSFVLALMLLVLPGSAHGQAVQLDPATSAFVDSAAAELEAVGLPGGPLRNKALEGASKGAAPEAIRAAVARLAGRLRTAAEALGTRRTESELVAAAALLDLGIEPRGIEELRAARQDGSIASALIGVAFLVQRGATEKASTEIVRAMLAASAGDADFVRFQRLVEQDLRSGAGIGGAAQARARAFIEHGTRVRSWLPDEAPG